MTPEQERDAAEIEARRIRTRDYRLTFGTVWGQAVLTDLADFCRAQETCVVPGDRDRTLVLEGRRETWLRIAQHMHLTPEQQFAIATGRTLPPGDLTDED